MRIAGPGWKVGGGVSGTGSVRVADRVRISGPGLKDGAVVVPLGAEVVVGVVVDVVLAVVVGVVVVLAVVDVV